MVRDLLLFVTVMGGLICEPLAAQELNSVGELSARAGWKGKDPNPADTFRFVVLGDRTGGHVKGQWEAATNQVNMLQPDFVMCIGDLIEGYTADYGAMIMFAKHPARITAADAG